MRKILVIAPHPDDEMIGCGGFILNKIKEGNEIFVIFLGYIGKKEREKEANEVKNKSGIEYINFLNIKEPFEFNSVNLNLLIKRIKEIDPNLILIPHKEDGDRDHKICYELSREAIWMSKIPDKKMNSCINKPTILLYEVHSPMTDVNYYEDISQVISKKIKLLGLYKSQMRYVDYTSAINGLNAYRGIMGGNCKYAEAFNIKKWSSDFPLV